MKQLLKDPEANKELLAPHKVDTSDYEKKVQEEMAAQQTEKQEPQKQENMEQRKEQQQDKSEQMQGKRGYQPIDESKINWQELEDRWGVKRDNLEKSGDLTKMLNYGKSDLVKVKPTFGGESFELDARLSPSRRTVRETSASCRTSSARSRSWMSTRNTNSPTMTGRTSAKRAISVGSWTLWTGKRARSSPPTSASTARRMKSRTFRQAGCASGAHRQDGNHHAGAGHAPRRTARTRQAHRAQRRQKVRHHPASERGAARRGVRAGNRQVARTAQTQETKGDTSKSQAQGGENAAQTKKGATPQHVDERGRQHPPHQQMERRELHRPAESRLCGG